MKKITIEKKIVCGGLLRSFFIDLEYCPDLDNEKVYNFNLVLAKAYERSKNEQRITTADLINDLYNTIEPEQIRAAVKELYKLGFLHTQALFTELNDYTLFIIKEDKIGEVEYLYELFNKL